jgi:antiviral helicase SKI2
MQLGVATCFSYLFVGRTKQRKVYVVSTHKRPVPLQHFLFHDDNMYSLMQAENSFKTGAIAAAVQKQKDKLKPKVKSAENAAMGLQRQAEKAAIAAQFTGGRGGSKGGAAGRGGKAGAVPTQRSGGAAGGNMAGGKGQWLSILRILRQGGREAAGSNEAIDFGVAYAGGLKSAQVKEEMAHIVRQVYDWRVLQHV